MTANVTSFRGKILVVRGGAIGDFILTLPALAALRGQFPQSWLEVLGYPHIVPLAVEGGLVNAVRSIEARALAGFFARHGELDPDLIDYFSEFDLIVSYLYDPDGIFQENVGKCITGQFIAGPHRPDEDTEVHAAKVFLQPLERLAIFEADPVPRLALAAPVRPSAQIALHPGSGSESKNWPEAKWHEFIRRLLAETPFSFLMVGGEAEGDRLQRFARELPGSRIILAQSLPLPELARRLEGCVAFVGHDSGISHLAAALGLPGVLLWGETAEEIWRPPSDKMLLIRGPTGLASLEVARVIEALQQVCAAPASKPSKNV